MDAKSPPALPKSLTEYCVDRIRQAIIDGSLQLGEQVSETALSASFGISKTPVREALARLQQEGLVVVHPRRGTFVFTPSEEELVEICDCRTTLETAALRMAMERDQPALAKTLSRVTQAMKIAWKNENAVAYRRLDSAFHLALFEHCGNRYLYEAYNHIAGKMAALRTRLSSSPHHMHKSYVEHLELARLVAEGGGSRALKLLEGHIGRRQGSYWMTKEVLRAAGKRARSSPR